ncbi:MAG: M23 family metallopeptidase [Owenweeksia sp.]|nr:M23 family metallopeptidase [Owenweeksia sp.]
MPLRLSGTFGELRGNHFHSGIDLKTHQKVGLPVRACAAGNIVRIKVSPYGFGKAIYIQHGNGFTTVYAHLEGFNEKIEAYVRKRQYEQETFDLNVYPEAGILWVEKGDVIAQSGNTGGSGAPHLHFEIRDTRTEKIINPLLFGFEVADSRAPDLHNVEVYQFEDDELVSSYTQKVLQQKDGSYSLTGNNLVEVQHAPAFGITTYDRLDGAPNRNGVYCIEMRINGELYYSFKMNTFSFYETRYINSHIDYSQKYCCRRNINKLYLEPNNQFSVYGVNRKMNLPELAPDSTYQVEIQVSDVAGNQSDLNFNLKYLPDTLLTAAPNNPPASVFRYGQPNFFKEENIQLKLPEGALYRDVYFEYKKLEPCAECYSFVHQLAAPSIPVQKYYPLRIKPNEPFKGDKSKLAIASLKDGRIDEYEGGEWDDGYITTRTRQFGQFAVVADTIPPSIQPIGFRDGGNLADQLQVSFKIEDNFSGIDRYRPTIDGKWVLFEYDAKNDLIFANLKDLSLEPGEHVLKLEVMDKVGNVTKKNYHLIF